MAEEPNPSAIVPTNEDMQEMRQMMAVLANQMSTLLASHPSNPTGPSTSAPPTTHHIYSDPNHPLPFPNPAVVEEEDYYEEPHPQPAPRENVNNKRQRTNEVPENPPPTAANDPRDKEEIAELRKMVQEMAKAMKKPEEVPTRQWKSKVESAKAASLPPNFIMPAVDKFAGNSDPTVFLTTYINTMTPFNLGEPTELNLFPRYLTGPALKWYHQTDIGQCKTIDELADALITRFNMFANVDVSRKKLRNLKQGPSEKFKAFMSRWKELAAEVEDIPDEEQQVTMILESLNDTYSSFLGLPGYTELKKLMIAGYGLDESLSRGEVSLQKGRLITKSTKPQTSHVNNVWAMDSRPPPRTTPKPTISRNFNASHVRNNSYRPQNSNFSPNSYPPNSYPQNNYPQNTFSQNSYRPPNNQNPFNSPPPNSQPFQWNSDQTRTRNARYPQEPPRAYDDLGMPLSQALPLLVSKGVIQIQMKDSNGKPMGTRIDLYCEYHQRKGHSTNACMTLKEKIQDLIDQEVITKPNVRKNPLPRHDVNVLGLDEYGFDPSDLICMIDPWILSNEEQEPNEVAPVLWWEEFEKKEEEKEVKKVAPVSWWEEIEKEEEKAEPINVTRAGTNFQPTFMRMNPPNVGEGISRNPTLSKDKGKAVMEGSLSEETDKFFSQLKKTNANLTIWELLMASLNHRQALLTKLNGMEVPATTTSEELVNMISARTASDSVVGFGKRDLPSEGSNHAKALYISTHVRGRSVARVLIDNGSALNVCPLRTAEKLGIKPEEMLPSDLCVKGFDCSKRNVVGNVVLSVKIGGVDFDVEFCVIDITPSYNMILGRPWIHSAGVIASSLHQKLRFERNGKIITVHGESWENEMGSSTSCVHPPEVEMSGFQVNMMSSDGKKKSFSHVVPKFSDVVMNMMTKMNYVPGTGLGARAERRVHPVEVVHKCDRQGLGYVPQGAKVKFDLEKMRIPKTLNGQFVRAGEKIPCFTFPEPFIHHVSSIILPGFEIFHDCPFKPNFSLFSRRMIGNEDDCLRGMARMFQEAQEDTQEREGMRECRATIRWDGVDPLDLVMTDDDDEDEGFPDFFDLVIDSSSKSHTLEEIKSKKFIVKDDVPICTFFRSQ